MRKMLQVKDFTYMLKGVGNEGEAIEEVYVEALKYILEEFVEVFGNP